MRRLIFSFLLSLFLATGLSAQEMSSVQDTKLLPKESPSLKVSEKDSLSSFVSEKSSDKGLKLDSKTRVKVLKKSRFLQRATLYKRETSTKEVVNRLFKVAFVEVLSGEEKGKTGWVVLSFRDTGSNPQALFSEVPIVQQEAPIQDS